MFPIGNQRVGILSRTPVLDVGGDPVVTEFGEPVYELDPAVVWVDGCLFESLIRRVAEDQSLATTTKEPAWAMMPVTDATKAITSSMALRHNGRDYVMRGDAVLEFDIRGVAQYVFCHCEHQEG